MRIAIASGKGGTGKTTLATGLVAALASRAERVTYADCDVEEPNGHIFLEPRLSASTQVTIPLPQVDADKCLLGRGESCIACGRACRFSAILPFKDRVLTFPKLCHGCAGCVLACPTQAIDELPQPVGVVEWGSTPLGIRFVQGRLVVGQTLVTPVIRQVVEIARAEPHQLVVLDAPPGTSCPVVETVKQADVALLVSEPTPFGLSDLKLAVAMVRQLGRPLGLVINKAGSGNQEIYNWSRRQDIPILLEIPDLRGIAESYSRGRLLTEALPQIADQLSALPEQLQKLDLGHQAVELEPFPGAADAVAGGDYPSESLPPGPGKRVTELVVISGKGGTGKTTVAASLVALAGPVVAADCDVDAADLHLLLQPRVERYWPFAGGYQAVLDAEKCTGCGLCLGYCRFQALRRSLDDDSLIAVDQLACEGCGVCVDHCPEQALRLEQPTRGELFQSLTDHGPLVHARLGIAEENSGKLVAQVRREARALAEARDLPLLICDGSPGIGCPVISSLTGAQAALIVTEPTLSGRHDLERLAELARQLHTKTFLCVNKADINPPLAEAIIEQAERLGIETVGTIPYHPAVTRAMLRGKPLVTVDSGPAARAVRDIWKRLSQLLELEDQFNRQQHVRRMQQ